MLPLHRQILIGLGVSLCVVGALAAAWWITLRPMEDSLASRLPADAVLAYIDLPAGDRSTLGIFAMAAPAGIELPNDIHNEATSLAAVRMADGTVGWLSFRRSTVGKVHIEGSSPSLESLLNDGSPSLASDKTFRALMWNGESRWVYFAFPRLLPEGSPLASMLALESPLAVRASEDGFTLRQPLNPTPRLAPWSGRPLVTVAGADVTLLLPSWQAMSTVGALLSPEAGTVIETLAGDFLADVANGVSLRYDASALLHGPSVFQSGPNGSGETVFSLEGNGSNAAETDRVLRALHDRYSSGRGSSQVRTVTAEGYVLNVMTREGATERTTERSDGAWTILETATEDGTLTSARDGTRFVVTTVPGGVTTRREGEAPTIDRSSIEWSPTAAARMAPFSQTLLLEGESLDFRLAEGPGYVEWTRLGRSGL